MNYIAYKLKFQTAVHFGNGLLHETENRFLADTLFSALCLEALKMGQEQLEKLYQLAKTGKVVFSDSFPYIGETLYIPKPMITIEHEAADIADRKKWKKLKYIALERMGDYFSGKMDVETESQLLGNLGNREVRQNVNLTNEEKTELYSVGVYQFHEKNGLYFLMGYEEEEDRKFLELLISSLGYQGIGGKVSAGLGKFEMIPTEISKEVQQRLKKENGTFVVLTTSLPKEDEMQEVLQSASYLLQRRAGFIRSEDYAKEFVKKQEQYFLAAGSVVSCRYEGDVYQVGTKGKHSVWRYGRAMVLEVSG